MPGQYQKPDKVIAMRIVSRRRDVCRLTRIQMAELLHMSCYRLRRIEEADVAVTLPELRRLAPALRTTVERLIAPLGSREGAK